jgi:sec-independent protein translocase protein TatB
MHFADSIVIFLLALILFGPKKLPEIARQIGKLMVEFRRASNEFKAQIDEELRVMEQQERQKKLDAAAAAQAAQAPALAAPDPAAAAPENAPAIAAETTAQLETPAPVILPPSTGETVTARRPNMPVASAEMLEAASAEPHPAYAEALAAEQNGNGSHSGLQPENVPENAQATVNHG